MHDSRILRNSSLALAFNDRLPFHNAIILGDSGFGLSHWLIPPIPAPSTPAEETFNIHHKRMRRLIECCNGLLKERFRCLHYLHYQPNFAGEIIKACCVLHNLMIAARPVNVDIDSVMLPEQYNVIPNQTNNRRREELLRHFS